MKKAILLLAALLMMSSVSTAQWTTLKAKHIKSVEDITFGTGSTAVTFDMEDFNKGCKTYIATIQQDTTGHPVATILRNEFTYAPVWKRTSTGFFTVSTNTLARGMFTLYKTVIEFSTTMSSTYSPYQRFVGYPYNIDSLKIYTYDTTVADNKLRKGYNWVKIVVWD